MALEVDHKMVGFMKKYYWSKIFERAYVGSSGGHTVGLRGVKLVQGDLLIGNMSVSVY